MLSLRKQTNKLLHCTRWDLLCSPPLGSRISRYIASVCPSARKRKPCSNLRFYQLVTGRLFTSKDRHSGGNVIIVFGAYIPRKVYRWTVINVQTLSGWTQFHDARLHCRSENTYFEVDILWFRPIRTKSRRNEERRKTNSTDIVNDA